MAYCFGLAICTGASSNTILDYNSVRFGVCMIKLCHQRMLILRCILPSKTELPPEKTIYPPPGHHLKNLEHPDKKLKSLGIF